MYNSTIMVTMDSDSVRKPKVPIEILNEDDQARYGEQKIPVDAPDKVNLVDPEQDTSTPEVKIDVVNTGDAARFAAVEPPKDAPATTEISAQETRDHGVIGYLQMLGDNWRSFARQLFHQDSFEADPSWWGEGELGEKIMSIHQEETLAMQSDVMALIEVTDDSASADTEGSVEEASADDIPIEIQEDHRNVEITNQIIELFGAENFAATEHTLQRHEKQGYLGGEFEESERNISSCTIRSTLNGLDALGIECSLSEEDLINRFGMDSFTESGFMHTYELVRLEQVAHEVNVLATPVTTMVEGMAVLRNDGVVIFSPAGESHSVLLSGLRNESDGLEVMMNDPLSEEGKWTRIEDLMDRYNHGMPEMYALFDTTKYFRDEQGDIKRISN